MKKILAILLITSLILTGCDSKKEVTSNDNTTNEVENVDKTEENKPIEEPIDKNEIEDSKEEPDKLVDTEKEETPKKDTVTDTSSTSKTEEPKEEIVKPQEPTCTAKKFDNKYSYVYSTKEECVSKGNDAFMNVYENIDDTVFTYGCKEIVDDCGTTWYGVYFNRWSDSGGDDVVKVYY